MKSAAALLISLLAAATACATELACPKVAPAAWNIGRKPLASVRVVSYPASESLGPDRDYYAAPPWDEREKAGYIYQTWHINDDSAAFKYEVDCVYAGTRRYVSLAVATTPRTCVARWRARRDHGVEPNSVDFSCK